MLDILNGKSMAEVVWSRRARVGVDRIDLGLRRGLEEPKILVRYGAQASPSSSSSSSGSSLSPLGVSFAA